MQVHADIYIYSIWKLIIVYSKNMEYFLPAALAGLYREAVGNKEVLMPILLGNLWTIPSFDAPKNSAIFSIGSIL